MRGTGRQEERQPHLQEIQGPLKGGLPLTELLPFSLSTWVSSPGNAVTCTLPQLVSLDPRTDRKWAVSVRIE